MQFVISLLLMSVFPINLLPASAAHKKTNEPALFVNFQRVMALLKGLSDTQPVITHPRISSAMVPNNISEKPFAIPAARENVQVIILGLKLHEKLALAFHIPDLRVRCEFALQQRLLPKEEQYPFVDIIEKNIADDVASKYLQEAVIAYRVQKRKK